ncbi:MAG: DUF397 domain-containing protein [Actinomycetota bacterium]|nr:DUF397 domain-containing protein [Actinomycetota bacterium]
MSNASRDAGWYKSSYSGGGSDQCVECRIVPGVTIGIRDSKAPMSGDLWIAPGAWTAFMNTIRGLDAGSHS